MHTPENAGKANKMDAVGFFIVVAVTIVVLLISAANKAAERRKKEARQYRQSLIVQYGKPLGLRFRQLVVQDEYGHLNYDRWERELTYFMRNVINMPKPKKADEGSYWSKYNDTRTILNGIARETSQTLPVMGDIGEVRNGIDYEHFMANQFKEAGWTTQVTKASGDQGADVKVWRDRVDAVVQCKWYQNAVASCGVNSSIAPPHSSRTA